MSLKERLKKIEGKFGKRVKIVFVGENEPEELKRKIEEEAYKEGFTDVIFISSWKNWMGQEFE